MGYGGGSFSELYHLNNGQFDGMQHSHNLIRNSFNYGLPSSFLIIGGMFFILFKSSSGFKFNKRMAFSKTKYDFHAFNNAWITSFIIFYFYTCLILLTLTAELV